MTNFIFIDQFFVCFCFCSHLALWPRNEAQRLQCWWTSTDDVYRNNSVTNLCSAKKLGLNKGFWKSIFYTCSTKVNIIVFKLCKIVINVLLPECVKSIFFVVDTSMDYLHLVEEHISEQTSFLQFDYGSFEGRNRRILFFSHPLFLSSSISVGLILFPLGSSGLVSSYSFKLSPSSSDADTDKASVFRPLRYASRGITFWDRKSSLDASFWATNGEEYLTTVQCLPDFLIFFFILHHLIRTQIGDLWASLGLSKSFQGGL